MPEYPNTIGDSWSQRMRLIRFRRKREKLSFWQEFKIVPRWLMWTVFVLFLIAQVMGVLINLSGVGGEVFPPELIGHPVLQSLALGGIITLTSLAVSTWIFMIAYVNRDAKRRGMSSGLWTLLVVVLSPAYLLIGFIIYFLMREPLPYSCPECGATVGPRFNYCPNCKCNLHPACPQCKREVVETDKFCQYCAQELGTKALSESAIERTTT
jgi:double zinc ribbon protein